jgi:hypothetical protein
MLTTSRSPATTGLSTCPAAVSLRTWPLATSMAKSGFCPMSLAVVYSVLPSAENTIDPTERSHASATRRSMPLAMSRTTTW